MIEIFSRVTFHAAYSMRAVQRPTDAPGLAWLRLLFFPGCCFFALIFSLSSHAAEVDGLYETEVLVTSQARDERNEAIRAALDEVLVRVSGDRNTPRREALRGLYKRSLQLVQQYRYRALPRRAGAHGELPGGLTQVLWVSFDPAAIDQALRRAAVPLWGQVRPATLVWVAMDDGGVRSLMGGDTLPQVKQVMQQQAQRRGLPLFVPLWDLEDQIALRFTDVWGNFQDAILRGSSRYATEAILVGRLFHQSDGIWKSRWTLYQGGEAAHWQASSPLQAEVLSAGVDGVADHLGRRFAKVFDESQSVRLKVAVKDVLSLEDYARTSQFLQSLDEVTSMQVDSLVDETVTYDLLVRGNSEGLAQTISFGRTLVEVPAVINVDAGDGLQTPSWETVDEAYDQLWYRLLP
ncbi:MAG: DUF2066 domain-containing protein [Gammaproteobacteria bacterium]|nr:DUF2066 domain-containing protein [Gammaproteobacteria bacterium]